MVLKKKCPPANPDKELLPGQHTRVRIKLDEIPNSVVVPEETIQIEQGGAYVMVVMPNNIVEQRFVVTGPRVEGEVLIRSGLSSGENIISEGMHRVRHGQQVEAMTPDEYEQMKARQDKEAVEVVDERGGDL